MLKLEFRCAEYIFKTNEGDRYTVRLTPATPFNVAEIYKHFPMSSSKAKVVEMNTELEINQETANELLTKWL